MLVPFTSEVLGDHGDDSTGVILYAAIMAAVTITFQVQIVYAYRKEMIRPELREYERQYSERPTAAAAVFLLSIPVALVSPLAATVMWLLVFVAGGQAVRWARARAERAAMPPRQDAEEGLERLAREVHGCRRCPRLVAWREEVSSDPPRRFRGERYWARPVSGFGDRGRGSSWWGSRRRPRRQSHRAHVHRRPLGRVAVRRAHQAGLSNRAA